METVTWLVIVTDRLWSVNEIVTVFMYSEEQLVFYIDIELASKLVQRNKADFLEHDFACTKRAVEV